MMTSKHRDSTPDTALFCLYLVRHWQISSPSSLSISSHFISVTPDFTSFSLFSSSFLLLTSLVFMADIREYAFFFCIVFESFHVPLMHHN